MTQFDDDISDFEADEAARIAALHATAPENIWLQIDPDAEQFDGWDVQTWCAEMINETDLKYIRADLVESLSQQLALSNKCLKAVREACLYSEDDGYIGVTREPHIPAQLFDDVCKALAATEPKP